MTEEILKEKKKKPAKKRARYLDERHILRHSTVMKILDISATKMAELVKDPNFPVSVAIGARARGIFSDELQAWMDRLPRQTEEKGRLTTRCVDLTPLSVDQGGTSQRPKAQVEA